MHILQAEQISIHNSQNRPNHLPLMPLKSDFHHKDSRPYVSKIPGQTNPTCLVIACVLQGRSWSFFFFFLNYALIDFSSDIARQHRIFKLYSKRIFLKPIHCLVQQHFVQALAIVPHSLWLSSSHHVFQTANRGLTLQKCGSLFQTADFFEVFCVVFENQSGWTFF